MKLTLVDNSDCLAFTSRDRLGLYEVNLRVATEHPLHSVSQLLFHIGNSADSIGKLFGVHLNIDIEGIVIMETVNNNRIVGGLAFFQKNGFNLAREYIYSADNHHIIASSHRLGHLDMGAAAGALFTGKNTDITSSVTEKREGFLVEGGENQLALGALGKNLACIGVNNLG